MLRWTDWGLRCFWISLPPTPATEAESEGLATSGDGIGSKPPMQQRGSQSGVRCFGKLVPETKIGNDEEQKAATSTKLLW